MNKDYPEAQIFLHLGKEHGFFVKSVVLAPHICFSSYKMKIIPAMFLPHRDVDRVEGFHKTLRVSLK